MEIFLNQGVVLKIWKNAERWRLAFLRNFWLSPFFVLDEVEADLNNLNVTKIAAYIHAKPHLEVTDGDVGKEIVFQSLVNSVTDRVYDKANAYQDQRSMYCHM